MPEQVRSCCQKIKDLCKLYFCCAPLNVSDGAHALQPLVVLFLFFITQLAVEILAEHNKGVRKTYLWLYVFTGFLTISIIFLISRAKKFAAIGDQQTNRKQWVFGYDVGTHLVATWLLWSCVIILVVFVFYAFRGGLPGQEPLRLRTTAVQVADYVTPGFAGLKKSVFLTGRNFSGGMPSKFELCVTVKDIAKSEWSAAYPSLDEVSPNKSLFPSIVQPVYVATDPPRFTIEGLDDDTLYLCTIYFEAAGKQAEEDRKLMSTLKETDAKDKKLIDELKKRYKDKAIEATKKINVDGLIAIDKTP